MLGWLLSPIDPSRGHEISGLIAWHARAMFVAWAILLPLGVLIARYLKITPSQDWPKELDNKFWWHSHLILQISGTFLMVLGIALIWSSKSAVTAHTILGWVIVLFAAIQIFSGWLRGSKGGPTDASPDGSIRGDHYDMTPRRMLFEKVHKSLGYVLLVLACLNISTGFWAVNAPIWMWLVTAIWWMLLIVMSWRLERRGPRPTTYQAIWGPDLKHPGNQNLSD